MKLINPNPGDYYHLKRVTVNSSSASVTLTIPGLLTGDIINISAYLSVTAAGGTYGLAIFGSGAGHFSLFHDATSYTIPLCPDTTGNFRSVIPIDGIALIDGDLTVSFSYASDATITGRRVNLACEVYRKY